MLLIYASGLHSHHCRFGCSLRPVPRIHLLWHDSHPLVESRTPPVETHSNVPSHGSSVPALPHHHPGAPVHQLVSSLHPGSHRDVHAEPLKVLHKLQMHVSWHRVGGTLWWLAMVVGRRSSHLRVHPYAVGTRGTGVPQAQGQSHGVRLETSYLRRDTTLVHAQKCPRVPLKLVI